MSNLRQILIVFAAAVLGLAAGYFLFGKTAQPQAAATHQHEQATQAPEKETVWTCSMHPQIRQNHPGKCPICGMDLIPLDELGSGGSELVLQMTEEAVKLASIQTVEVGTAGGASSTKTIQLNGRILADERYVSSQVAHLPGRIEQLFVSFTGETVRKGQKLATIYSPELISAQKELIEARKWAATQPQLLEAVRNKLRYWKLSPETIADIEASGQIRETVTVFADRSGVVLKRRVAVGDYVKPGTVLFDLADLNRLWVAFDAYEQDLSSIHLGDRISFTVAALPDKTFTTTVNFIDPVVNPQTRAAMVRGDVNNGSGLLKPDMFARGTLQTRPRTARGQLTVPRTAVLWTGKRSVVYVQVPDASVPSFEFREITLGDAVGDDYIVVEGLQPGERVVVNGAFVIDAAAQLNNMNSMMNRLVKGPDAQRQVPNHKASTPEAFKRQLHDVVMAYIKIEQALVKGDQTGAAQAAANLQQALDKVDMGLLEGDAHMYWMEQLEALEAHASQIASDKSLDEQRRQFSFLTTALDNAVRAFGTAGSKLYLIHCPMAFDNQGADWLSTEPKVLNPYFGDAMLTCGVVKDSIQ